MKNLKIEKHRLLVSKSVVGASKRLLKRVDEAVAKDPQLTAKVKAIMVEARVAVKLEEARKSCGLTQKELAARMGTSQPQIARLESRGYTGSLRTLVEYAAACGKDLKISLG